MDAYRISYIWALLLLFSLEGHESCSCGRSPMQLEFCKTDFVLLAVVDSVALMENGTEWFPQPNSWDGVKFLMRDVRVIRSSEDYKSTADKEHIHTAAYGALCGAYLRNQTEYVIFGQVRSGMLWTSSCSRTKPWHWVIKKYRDDYINNLPGYCSDCKIHTCLGSRAHPNCQDKPGNAEPNTCLLRDRKCALRAYCRKSSQTGSCAWHHVMDGEPMRCDNVEPEIEPVVTLPPLPTIPDAKKAKTAVNETGSEVDETGPEVDAVEVNNTSVPEVETTTENIKWFGAELPLARGDVSEEDLPVSLPDPEAALPEPTGPEVVDSTESEVETRPGTDSDKPEEISAGATEVDDSHVDPNLINPGV